MSVNRADTSRLTYGLTESLTCSHRRTLAPGATCSMGTYVDVCNVFSFLRLLREGMSVLNEINICDIIYEIIFLKIIC